MNDDPQRKFDDEEELKELREKSILGIITDDEKERADELIDLILGEEE